MGEYQALMRLKKTKKDNIVPLIMIPPIEYDFEEMRLKKTIQEHIEPFGDRLKLKWGKRVAFIDLHESLESLTMDNGQSVLRYIFSEIKEKNCHGIPVVNFSRTDGFINDLKIITDEMQTGVMIRIGLTDLMTPMLNTIIEKVKSDLKLDNSQVDILIDIAEPDSFEPYSVFANALSTKIKSIIGLCEFRSFIISGISLKLSDIKKPGGKFPRHEWYLYKELVSKLESTRTPTYSDYTIETPQFLSMDMRMMKPAGKIVYTCEDFWFVVKGKSFRGNEDQIYNHCQTIINSGYFCGTHYSYGDEKITNTNNLRNNPGNLGTWKQVGVNHHITMTVEQVSNFHV
jgi:hypothetical protein